MPTVNAFTMKPSVTQILSYCIVIAGIIIFYKCITPNMFNIAACLVFSIMYGVSVIILIIFSALSSCLDPTDPVIMNYRQCLKQGRAFDSGNYYYCESCKSYCNQTSKHCKICQRCVNVFDHHCMWINNCIGEKNYNYFMIMIIFVLFKFVFFIAATIYLSVERRFMEYLGQMIACWVYVVVAVIFGTLNLHLVILHFYLIYKGITNFQYIQIQRQNQKKRRQIQDQVSKHNLTLQKYQRQLKIQERKSDKFTQHPTSNQNNLNIRQTHFIYQQNSSSSQKKQVPKVFPSNQFLGDLSIKHDSQYFVSKYHKPKIQLNKFFTGNKSMQFIGNLSIQDVEQPKIHRSNIQ